MLSKYAPVRLAIPVILFLLTASCAISQRAHPPLFTPAAKKYLETGSFREIHTVAALPQSVKSALAEREGEKQFRMADPGKPFQSTDAVEPGNLPWRRLVFAGVSDQYCLVEYEHGGIALTDNALFFRLEGGQARVIWSAYTGRCENMKELRRELGTSEVAVTTKS